MKTLLRVKVKQYKAALAAATGQEHSGWNEAAGGECVFCIPLPLRRESRRL